MYPDDKDIGELLLRAGIISEDQHEKAIKLAGSKKLLVGQMLIMAGYISPKDLQAAVDAVSMLRDHKINDFQAQHCLKIACKTKRKFGDVVREQIPTAKNKDDYRARPHGNGRSNACPRKVIKQADLPLRTSLSLQTAARSQASTCSSSPILAY